jgi:hypothetical protein
MWGENIVKDQRDRRRIVMSSGIIIGIILIMSIGVLIFSGWAIFQRVSVEHISIHSDTLKLLFLGLLFGLLGVLFLRRGRKGR